MPLSATVTALPCRGGERFLRGLFEPLGYDVAAERHPLDEAFPEWGESPYFRVTLSATCRLCELLTHLYVLLPVLDDVKHYWVGREELEKLLAKGEGWLETHPEKERIVERYLKHRTSLTREALSRLVAEEEPNLEEEEDRRSSEEEALERPLTLNEQRLGTVVAALREAGARSVIDLGCGEGNLLKVLLKDTFFTSIAGMDVSHRALEMAAKRLRLADAPQRVTERIKLFQGALTYRDERLHGYDAACVIEVIEHLEPSRLPAFERVLLQHARPRVIIVTTPNVEYNVQFENLPPGKLRHRDHRFEWTRAEFSGWCERVAGEYGYSSRVLPVGEVHPEHGSPTQMGVLVR
jgi:3' terminal RNA ribose 2'-O-methyltransferase Hen1